MKTIIATLVLGVVCQTTQFNSPLKMTSGLFGTLVDSVAISSDGEYVAAGLFVGDEVIIWSLPQKRVVARFDARVCDLFPQHIAFLDDNPVLTTASDIGGVADYDLVTKHVTLLRKPQVKIQYFCPDLLARGKIAEQISDHSVMITGLSNLNQTWTWHDHRPFDDAVVSFDGSHVVALSQSEVTFVDVPSRQTRTVKVSDELHNIGMDHAVSSDGSRLVIQGFAGKDYHIFLLDKQFNYQPRPIISDMRFRPTIVLLSRDGQKLAMNDGERNIDVYQIPQDGTQARLIGNIEIHQENDEIEAAQFAPDGMSVAVGTLRGDVVIYRLQDRTTLTLKSR